MAVAAHYLLNFDWAVGFCAWRDYCADWMSWRRWPSRGGSAFPRRIVVVLEGEGLANDATALVLYRFAVAAVGDRDIFASEGRRALSY